MFDILTIVPGKKKRTGSGWTSFNAICCSHRGHKPDRRSRGGIKFDGQYNWVMHCFNCGYSCNFTLGRSISAKTRQFLTWCGIDIQQIQKWSLESLQHKDMLDFTQPERPKVHTINFSERSLPKGAIKLEPKTALHKIYLEYLRKRSIDTSRYDFYITPDGKDRYGNRIIVPYTYKGKIIGNTSRFLDNRTPKYLNDQPNGYVFNIDKQLEEWQVCIVTEGIFDAIAIDGVAIMHDDISAQQAQLLASLNKRIIVVPDFDSTGLTLVDRALELGYSVSMPPWGPEIKDVNDAVVKYGKLPTVLAILQNATMSKIKLELRKKQIGKQIGI